MPNTEQDDAQQFQEYQRQKMRVWDVLLVVALALVGTVPSQATRRTASKNV